MKDYKQILEGFIRGGKKEELYIRNIVKQFTTLYMDEVFINKLGNDYEEEIISKLREKLISSKSWKSYSYISKNYLRSIVKNLIADMFEEEFPVISLQEKIHEDGEESLTYEGIISDTREALAEVYGNLIFEKLVMSIDEQDITVLCYYFNKALYGVEIELKEISKDNLYKRWERLRNKKLKKIFEDVTQEEFRIAVERFLSEVCRDRGYIK